MKRLFKKIAAPVGVMVLALTGAFLTTSMKADNSLALKDGYRKTPSGCTINKTCSTVVNDVICTIMDSGQTVQLYGKFNPGDTTCPQVLYEPQN